MLVGLARIAWTGLAVGTALLWTSAVYSASSGDPAALVQSQHNTGNQFGDIICWGWDVDMQGDVAVAVAPYAPRTVVFERSGASWNGTTIALDGTSVATDGTRVVMQGTLVGSFPISHAQDVDVFVKSGGSWAVEQRITAGANQYQTFAKGLDVFGERLAVTGTGEVEIWERQAGTWVLATTVVGSDTQPGDEFGYALSLYDRVLVVGAAEAGGGIGAAYVFLEVGGQWSEVAKLTPSGGQPGWNFGLAVAVHKGWLAVGVPGYSVGPDDRGAVCVYRQAGPSWLPVQTIVYETTATSSPIGGAVDLDEDWLLAGYRDPFFFGAAARQGPLYYRQGDTWVDVARLDSSLQPLFSLDTWAGAVGVQPGWAIMGYATYAIAGVVQFYALEPPPAAFCTGKLNSDGCVGAIDFCGLPSVTQPIPFDVVATDVLGQKPGLLIYGFGADAIPFLGGTLCIQPSVRRTPTAVSSGDATPCSGAYTFDFQARIASGVDPLLVPGAGVVAQYWHRDPQASFGAGLTDALAFTVWP